MSSHHIIREKQEPALLIINLEHFNPEWLGQLLEWSPTLIATAAVAEQLVVNDIHIDWLLTGNGGSITAQAATKTIASNPENWIKDALHLLIAEGYPTVNIITDDFRPEIYLSNITQISLVIYCREQKIYAIEPGFEKWKPAGSLISIINPPPDLECKNLVVVDNGTYKVQQDGFIKIDFSHPTLFIVESL